MDGAPMLSIPQNQIERLAEKLRAEVRPGHVDYISKADAGRVLTLLIREAQRNAPQPCPACMAEIAKDPPEYVHQHDMDCRDYPQ